MANPKRYSEKVRRKVSEENSALQIPTGSYNMMDNLSIIQPHFESHFTPIHRSAKIRAKMEISQPEDQSEIQADEMVESFLQGDADQSQQILSQPISEISRSGEGEGMETSNEFDQQLQNTKGGGQKLDEGIKSELEEHTGANLGGVNIHTGAQASEMSESISAKAFASGQEIYFKDGEYDTQSEKGKGLLAHEVAHTVQDGGGVQAKIQRDNDAPNMLLNPSFDTIRPFGTISPSLLSSYWFGIISSYFTLVVESAETLERIKKNKEEEDKLFFLAWQKRPEAQTNQDPVSGFYSFEHGSYDQEKRVNKSAIFDVKSGESNEEVYYTLEYRSADRENTDLLSELNIRFVYSKKSNTDLEIIAEDAIYGTTPEPKDGSVDHDKKRRIRGGAQGTGGTPFEDSFPKFGTKVQGDTWQSLFFASDRGLIDLKRITAFLYAGYLAYRDTPADGKGNRVKDGKPLSTYHINTVLAIEWDAKTRKQQLKRKTKGKTYDAQAGWDRFLVMGDFIETSVLDPDTNKKIIDPYSITIKFLNKDVKDEMKDYTPSDKDYIDARIAYDKQHYYVPNILGLDDIVDPEERLAVKYVAYSLVNYEKSIPVTTEFDGWQYNDYRNFLSGMRGMFKSSKPIIRDKEFDLILPINKTGNPDETEYYYYTFSIESNDINATETPRIGNETQEEADARRKKEVDVFVKRIGKKGETEFVAHTETEVNVAIANGFPAEDAKPDVRKKYVKERYPALVNVYKSVIDYSAQQKFKDSLSKAINDNISIAWFANNYQIKVHDSIDSIKQILIDENGYNDPSLFAHYNIIDDNIIETKEPVNILPAADEKVGDQVDAQKYNFEFVTGVNESREYYEKRMIPPEVGKENDYRFPVKQVYDETIGITSWKKSELVALEASLEALPLKFVKMLPKYNFFRQKMCLKQGGHFSAGGKTEKTAIAIYGNAFHPESTDSFFTGNKNKIYTTLMIPLVHEIGHAVSDDPLIYTLKGIRYKGTIGLLFYAYTKDLAVDHTPTNYSETNYEENFAESFMLYNLDPEFLITNYPEIYWWFDYLTKNSTPPEPDAVKKLVDDKRAKNTLYIR